MHAATIDNINFARRYSSIGQWANKLRKTFQRTCMDALQQYNAAIVAEASHYLSIFNACNAMCINCMYYPQSNSSASVPAWHEGEDGDGVRYASTSHHVNRKTCTPAGTFSLLYVAARKTALHDLIILFLYNFIALLLGFDRFCCCFCPMLYSYSYPYLSLSSSLVQWASYFFHLL